MYIYIYIYTYIYIYIYEHIVRDIVRCAIHAGDFEVLPIHPISLLTVSLLRLLDSNFPGNSLWA